jgi:hypothetical protein
MPSLDSYYQPDFSHRKPKASKPSTAPQYEIGLDGVPVRTSNPSNPTGGIMGGLPTDYKSTEASAFASAARHRGEMADIRGGGGDTSSGRKPLPQQEVWKVPDSTVYSGRGDTRTSPTGVLQTGTDMSRSFNDLLATTNTSGYPPFGSNQLPTTAGSPDAAVSPKTQAITNIGPVADGQEYANNLGRQGTSGIGPVADGQVYGNTLENAPGAGTAGIGPLADGGAYARALGKGGGSTSRLDAALSDTAGMQSYMSKFSSGDRERAANRAFLDTEGSMEGLRAKEAVNGVVYAGGQHYIRDGEDKQTIDRSQARQISSGQAKAQDFLQSKIDTTIDTQKQTPAEAQDPLSAAGSIVKSGFGAAAKTDRKLQGKSAARDGVLGGILAGAKTDFDLNNSI